MVDTLLIEENNQAKKHTEIGFSARRIINLLKSKNISQKAFYEELKIKGFPYSFEALKSYLRKTDPKDPSSATIYLMSKILKVNIDELFYSEESKYFKINKNISYEIILNREIASILNQKCNKLNISHQEYIKSLIISNLSSK